MNIHSFTLKPKEELPVKSVLSKAMVWLEANHVTTASTRDGIRRDMTTDGDVSTKDRLELVQRLLNLPVPRVQKASCRCYCVAEQTCDQIKSRVTSSRNEQ